MKPQQKKEFGYTNTQIFCMVITILASIIYAFRHILFE